MAALAYVNTKKSAAGTSTPVTSVVTGAAALAATNALVVAVAWVGADPIRPSSITNTAGDVFRPVLGSFYRAADNSCAEWWYCLNSLGNAADIVTVNFTQGATFTRVIANQYSGAASVNALDQSTIGYAASAASVSAAPITIRAANEVIAAFCAAGSGSGAYTAGGGFVLRDVKLTDTQTEDNITARDGSYTPSISYSTPTELVFSAVSLSDTPVPPWNQAQVPDMIGAGGRSG